MLGLSIAILENVMSYISNYAHISRLIPILTCYSIPNPYDLFTQVDLTYGNDIFQDYEFYDNFIYYSTWEEILEKFPRATFKLSVCLTLGASNCIDMVTKLITNNKIKYLLLRIHKFIIFYEKDKCNKIIKLFTDSIVTKYKTHNKNFGMGILVYSWDKDPINFAIFKDGLLYEKPYSDHILYPMFAKCDTIVNPDRDILQTLINWEETIPLNLKSIILTNGYDLFWQFIPRSVNSVKSIDNHPYTINNLSQGRTFNSISELDVVINISSDNVNHYKRIFPRVKSFKSHLSARLEALSKEIIEIKSQWDGLRKHLGDLVY